jgi:TonB family protein
MLGRFESLACAIVSFHIDGSGEPYDARVTSSYPVQGIGRAAMEALKSYKFVPGDDGRRRFFLMLKYNRFELR